MLDLESKEKENQSIGGVVSNQRRSTGGVEGLNGNSYRLNY